MTPPAAAAAAPATRPAPVRRPAARPRRVSAPVRRPARADALLGSRLLDRLIRGRAWIALVAFALIGIVAMQLWLLKLNGGIGRAIEHEGLLARENAALSAENSAMSAGDLVERQAIAKGMTIVAPGSLRFLYARPAADERLAAARLAQPVQPVQPAQPVAEASRQVATQGSGSPTTAEPTTAEPNTTETTQTAAQPEPGH